MSNTETATKCECGATMPAGRRFCDKCQTEKRKVAARERMKKHREKVTTPEATGAEPTPEVEPKTPAQPKATLTEAAKIRLCNSNYHMTAYLMYGAGIMTDEVVAAPALIPDQLSFSTLCRQTRDSLGLQPTPMAWRVAGEDINVTHSYLDWTTLQWQGFYWNAVCYIRSLNNQPLNLPHYGKLGTNIKATLNQFPKERVYTMIMNLLKDFPVVRHQMGKIGEGLMLDETSLNHAVIKKVLLSLPPSVSPEMESLRRDAEKGPKTKSHEYESL